MKTFTRREIDRAHSAASDLPVHAIGSDHRSRRDFIFHQNARSLGEDIGFEKSQAVSPASRSENSFRLALQLFVAAAGLAQELAPLSRIKFERRSEHFV
jgi:hypothetical protein